MNNLELVLQVSQKHVSIAQAASNRRVDDIGLFEPFESVQGVMSPDALQFAAVEDLKRLGEKFDFPNSAASQLHVTIETGRPFKLLINTALDIADLVDSCEIEILAIYKWLNQIQETTAGIAVPGYDSSLCQSEAFESFAPRIVISLEHPDRRSYCPVTALRTKPKVNTVERPLARRLRQDLRDAPG